MSKQGVVHERVPENWRRRSPPGGLAKKSGRTRRSILRFLLKNGSFILKERGN